MSGPTNVLWYSSVAIRFLFCLHLLWTRIAYKYPVFTLYLGCAVLRSLGAMLFTPMADGALPETYTYFWLWTEPVLLLLQIGVAFEVHAALWKDNSAIAKSARPLLVFALLTALVFAALPVHIELSKLTGAGIAAVMQFEFLAKRYLSTVLATFLVLSAVLYLLVVHNSLTSNKLRHESMLAAYFAIYAVCYLIMSVGWQLPILVNNYMLSALTVCLVVWMSIFRPSPETAAA
jgi:hypothetical protein